MRGALASVLFTALVGLCPSPADAHPPPGAAGPAEFAASSIVKLSALTLLLALSLGSWFALPRSPGWCSLGRTIAAGLVLAFVIESAPHLVHHLFDRHGGKDCIAYQVSSHADGAVGATTDVRPTESVTSPGPQFVQTVARLAPLSNRGRAPPA